MEGELGLIKHGVGEPGEMRIPLTFALNLLPHFPFFLIRGWFIFLFLLKYSLLTMFCLFQVYNKVIHIFFF